VGQKGSEGAEIEMPKASRGMGYGEGVSQKIFAFFIWKWRALLHPERHFCQEILAGYSDYNTMFAGQAAIDSTA